MFALILPEPTSLTHTRWLLSEMTGSQATLYPLDQLAHAVCQQDDASPDNTLITPPTAAIKVIASLYSAVQSAKRTRDKLSLHVQRFLLGPQGFAEHGPPQLLCALRAPYERAANADTLAGNDNGADSDLDISDGDENINHDDVIDEYDDTDTDAIVNRASSTMPAPEGDGVDDPTLLFLLGWDGAHSVSDDESDDRIMTEQDTHDLDDAVSFLIAAIDCSWVWFLGF